MLNDTYLVFRLEGPLQSWGERSKWDYRDTEVFPSKSGVVGLIACAMGIERNDSRIGEMCSQLSFAVRADRPGRIVEDFHTVQADKLLTAGGGKRNKTGEKGTIVSHRSYLQDASFLVALSGPAELLEKIKEALSAPEWQIYLGRKSCVPSVPVLGELCSGYDGLEDIMQRYPLTERKESTDAILYQIDSTDGSGYFRNDIRNASRSRSFARRLVATKKIKEEQHVFI